MFMHSPNRRALFLMASMISGATIVPMVGDPQPHYRRPIRTHKLTPIPKLHGERECSRRRRQIANGQLTKANGLA